MSAFWEFCVFALRNCPDEEKKKKKKKRITSKKNQPGKKGKLSLKGEKPTA